MTPTPEALARKNIDDQLTASGWSVQDRGGMNLYAALRNALVPHLMSGEVRVMDLEIIVGEKI
jgi:hypothetical protein